MQRVYLFPILQVHLLWDHRVYGRSMHLSFALFIAYHVRLQLESSDKEVIRAGVNALGGLFCDGLTRDCTHLLATCPGSEKYNAAMHFQFKTVIKVILPHWFDDCFRLMRLLDEGPYEWPNPPVLEQPIETAEKEKNKELVSQVTPNRQMLFRMALLAVNSSFDKEPEFVKVAIQQDLWKGRRVLLGVDLGLGTMQREALK
jgi:hypothetical protein